MQRKAIVIGATGRIGQALVYELSSLYATVTVIGRTAPKYLSSNTHVYTLSDFDNLPQTLSAIALDEQTDAFCCLSAKGKDEDAQSLQNIYYAYPKIFAQICHEKGVRRLFLLAMNHKNHQYQQLHQELLTLDWALLVVFLVDRLKVSSQDFSFKGLTSRAKQLLGQVVFDDTPLTPKQVGVSMALVAFWTLYDRHYVDILMPTLNAKPIDDPKISYISHQQMLKLTTKNTNHTT